jgi:hypothetical protein
MEHLVLCISAVLQPPLGSDVEYLIRRATALKQQQAAALALAGGSKQAGVGKGKEANKKQGGGALGKVAEQAAASGPAGTGPVVTLEHLLTAMKETGAVSKLQGGAAGVCLCGPGERGQQGFLHAL